MSQLVGGDDDDSDAVINNHHTRQTDKSQNKDTKHKISPSSCIYIISAFNNAVLPACVSSSSSFGWRQSAAFDMCAAVPVESACPFAFEVEVVPFGGKACASIAAFKDDDEADEVAKLEVKSAKFIASAV
jgi:hypothetical protein